MKLFDIRLKEEGQYDPELNVAVCPEHCRDQMYSWVSRGFRDTPGAQPHLVVQCDGQIQPLLQTDHEQDL